MDYQEIIEIFKLERIKGSKMITCGIDEAGRGPVIGPLVIAGVCVDEEGEESLKALNVRDSKLILPKKREELFERIKKVVKSYEIIIVEPKEIDIVVLSKEKGDNLNWLEARKSVEIINKLKPEQTILDCPSNNPKAYNDYVNEILETKSRLVCEHKADAKYPSVAAASILAKVTRDREIKKLEKKYGRMGSGYPSDPVTKQFLQENFNKHPEIFRHSWATYKNAKKAAAQSDLGRF